RPSAVVRFAPVCYRAAARPSGARSRRQRVMGPLRPTSSSRHPERRLRLRSSERATDTRAGAACWVYGRHAVAAALANPERLWTRLVVLGGQEREARALVASARAPRRGNGEPIHILDRSGFATLLSEAAVHQGLALAVEPLAEPDLEDVLRR